MILARVLARAAGWYALGAFGTALMAAELAGGVLRRGFVRVLRASRGGPTRLRLTAPRVPVEGKRGFGRLRVASEPGGTRCRLPGRCLFLSFVACTRDYSEMTRGLEKVHSYRAECAGPLCPLVTIRSCGIGIVVMATVLLMLVQHREGQVTHSKSGPTFSAPALRGCRRGSVRGRARWRLRGGQSCLPPHTPPSAGRRSFRP